MINWMKLIHLKMTVAGLGMLMLTACNGIFDDVYDEPQEIVPAKGQIVMNVTSCSILTYELFLMLHFIYFFT